MTQYLKIDSATEEVVGGCGLPDAPDLVGPLEPEPPAEDGITFRPWQTSRLSYSARPSPAHILKWPASEIDPIWVDPRDLDQAKAAAWERIKDCRDVAEASDFTCGGLVYQADKARISGAALAALMAQVASAPYSIEWTLSDNSVTTLSAPQMSAVGVALMEHVSSAFSIARTLRAQIEAATTIEEVTAITWTEE